MMLLRDGNNDVDIDPSLQVTIESTELDNPRALEETVQK